MTFFTVFVCMRSTGKMGLDLHVIHGGIDKVDLLLSDDTLNRNILYFFSKLSEDIMTYKIF